MIDTRAWETRGPRAMPLRSTENSPTSGATGYWTIYIIIVFTVFGINIFTDAVRYADFDNYIYYLNGLVHFPQHSWWYFETFSNLFLLGAHGITRSVLGAMILAHYVLGFIFVLLLPMALPPRRTPWPALLLAFAMLGPLLGFVTMRATPAYFLVAIGVQLAVDRRPMAWVCLAIASFFHISSLLAALPMALLYFERNLPGILRSDLSRRYYLISTLVLVLFGAILPQLSGTLTSIVHSIPVISKYDIYTNNNDSDTKIGHYIFIVFVSALTLLFMAVRKEQGSKLHMYVLTSFALYVVMFFAASPVAAFRQAPFWMMPMIAALPWNKLGVNQATAPVFVLGCIGLFLFQFGQVYF